MSYTDNEIIDSYDGERYELSKLFVEGMIDAGFGIPQRDSAPTIINNDPDTLRFEYDEGYGFASEMETHFGEDRESRLLIYVRDKKKSFESDYLFRLIALDNDMALKISSVLEKYFSGFHVSCQQFGKNYKRYWA